MGGWCHLVVSVYLETSKGRAVMNMHIMKSIIPSTFREREEIYRLACVSNGVWYRCQRRWRASNREAQRFKEGACMNR